ncbi:MAG TPA: SMC-Scp complex subunit ScpB [Chitinophagaceae bacterium]
MEISNLIPHIESLIFASDKPLTSAEITDLINQAFGFMEDKLVQEQIDTALEGIVEKYNSEFYPFEVRESGGGWQFLTKKDYHKTVAQLNGEKFLKRLSSAALETLAIIAYKQPITKGEIESIRGVSSDYSVQKLLEKELIIISGRNEKLPGHPLVYATSKNFMDYFGINSPEDLPKIREVLANQIVEPTIINHTEFEEGSLIVSDGGELIDKTIPDEDPIPEPYVNGHSFDIEEVDPAGNETHEATSEEELNLENDEANSEEETELPEEEQVSNESEDSNIEDSDLNDSGDSLSDDTPSEEEEEDKP